MPPIRVQRTAVNIVAILLGGAGTAAITIAVTTKYLAAAESRKRQRDLDYKLRTTQPPATHRLPDVEQQLAAGFFDGIRKAYASYGEIFASFAVFRTGPAIRMNLETRNEWHVIRPFYRSLALRHLWRGLVQLTRSNNVTICVDADTARIQTWTAFETRRFDDGGTIEPWANAGNVGTLVTKPAPARTNAHETNALRDRRRRRH